MLPKSTRYECHEYLDHVRSLPCIGCPAPSSKSDAHHMVPRSVGGSDLTAVPLCRECHSALEHIGPGRFSERRGIDLWEEAHEILRRWIERKDDA